MLYCWRVIYAERDKCSSGLIENFDRHHLELYAWETITLRSRKLDDFIIFSTPYIINQKNILPLYNEKDDFN